MGMSLRVIAELIILFGRICCALVAVVGTMAFASYLIASPVDATPRMDAESGAIWTLVPVHIDLSHQPYEREPDRYPFKFSAGPALKVIDNATFSLMATPSSLPVSRGSPRGRFAPMRRVGALPAARMQRACCGLPCAAASSNAAARS